jgi:hypothetical protein
MKSVKKLADTVIPVRRKTPEMEALLSVGYGMDLAKAKAIIKEREADPHTHPYESYEKAQAFIEAYEADEKKLQPTSKRQGWKRDPQEPSYS